MSVADSVKQNEAQKFTTPKGKTVYGGGGISPDVFVPLDTAGMNDYFMTASRRNFVFRFAMQFVDQHRKAINNIKSAEELNKLYAPYDFVELFAAYARKNELNPKQTEIKESAILINTYLKAYIGRATPLDDEGFYPFIAKIDNTVQKAEEVLRGTR